MGKCDDWLSHRSWISSLVPMAIVCIQATVPQIWVYGYRGKGCEYILTRKCLPIRNCQCCQALPQAGLGSTSLSLAPILSPTKHLSHDVTYTYVCSSNRMPQRQELCPLPQDILHVFQVSNQMPLPAIFDSTPRKVQVLPLRVPSSQNLLLYISPAFTCIFLNSRELFAVKTIFIDSFHQYLLIIFCVTHIVPDTGYAAMKKNGPTLMRLMSLWWEDRQLTHQAHSMSDSGKCSQHDGKTWEATGSF